MNFFSDWTRLLYKKSIKGNQNLIWHDYNPNEENDFWLVKPLHSSWRHPFLLTKKIIFFSTSLPSTPSSLSSKYFNFNLTTLNYFRINCKSIVLITMYLIFNLLLKTIFSVQNSNLMFSVDFSPDLVQFRVRETTCDVFLARRDIPIQVSHMVEVMRKDFSDHHSTQVPMTENQLGEMQMK